VIEPGNASRRATVSLTWPYVWSGDGLGSITLRYLAEVDPGSGGRISERLLGGAVLASHLAWEIDHRMYDERGSGVASIAYLPALPELGGIDVEPAELRVRLRYATDAAVSPPLLRIGLDRDDARVPGRWEYDLGVVNDDGVVQGRFDARGFIDSDSQTLPSQAPTYAGTTEPRRTIARLRLEPLAPGDVDLGPVRLIAAELDVGAFEDVSDPTNRSAAVLPFTSAGRARIVHVTQLEPWRPWAGVQFDARNAFEGSYYDTGERQVVWRSEFALRQAFGNAGALTLTLDRDINEGETPLRFDSRPRRNTIVFGARLRLAPSPAWSLEHDAGYILLDTRRPEDRGWQPFDTRLELLRDVSAVSLRLQHRLDVESDALHTLEANLELRERRGATELSVGLRHLQDFAPQTTSGASVAATLSSARLGVAVERVISASIETAYRPQPAPAADGSLPVWAPLEVRLELGTMRQLDTRPGLRVELRYDLNQAEAERLTVSARARLLEAEIEASQRIDLPSGVVQDARVTVSLPEQFSVVLRGVPWLPVGLLGIATGEAVVRPLSLSLRDTPASGPARWEINLRTTLDPGLLGGEPGRRDTLADLRVELTREQLGPIDLTLTGFAEWRLRDDMSQRTYLRRASLTLGVDAFERVGLQGTVGYVGAYSDALDEFTRSELQLQRLTLSVRASDQLSFGAQLSDVWDLTGRLAGQSPWNLRPEVFVVWDRCCWAVAAAYDTGSGALRLVLTGPGARTGIEEIIPTPFGLERRPLPTPEVP